MVQHVVAAGREPAQHLLPVRHDVPADQGVQATRIEDQIEPFVRIVAEQVPSAAPEPTRPGDDVAVSRPKEMTGWPATFVQPLLTRIAAASTPPTTTAIAEHLSNLTVKKAWSDMVLTGLSMLERKMRMDDLPTTLPLNPSHGAMERLQNYFGPDYSDVLAAVSLRHDLLQNLEVEDTELERVATRINDLVRRHFQVAMSQA
jgi:hypothetical protein